jgi:glucan phosphoethanolaminetransferase (alkaline phosphatase superfamily)
VVAFVVVVICLLISLLLGKDIAKVLFSMIAIFGVGCLVEIILRASKQQAIANMVKLSIFIIMLLVFITGIEPRVNSFKEKTSKITHKIEQTHDTIDKIEKYKRWLEK